jgi:hypothetical protein
MTRTLCLALSAILCATSAPALAQSGSAGRTDEGAIVVTGKRTPDGKKIPMSDWHVAETSHVLVYSKGGTDRATRVAHNLEKLHFLLSIMFDRLEAPDDTLKLSVTLIGDRADFNHLGLDNLGWQPGPYPRAFPTEVHYDPREDGAVLATTNVDHQIVLQPGTHLSSSDLQQLTAPAAAAQGNGPPGNMASSANSAASSAGPLQNFKVNELAFPMTAEGRIYAGFARHYLLTYFPNAYPRWYLEGFGEIFATMVANGEGRIEYGHTPPGFRQVMEWYGRYPLANVLNGKYLQEKSSRPDWTPYHAWALTHLLFFSDEREVALTRYLAAFGNGAGPEEAAKALGDLEQLQRDLAAYRGRKVPFEVLTYPAEQIPAPIVRNLTKGEATLVRGRLELGARVQIPPAPPAGADLKTADRMAKARRIALEDRAAWLQRLRDNAAKYSYEVEAQLLLAEAECRSGNNDQCLAASERALGLEPANASALAWQGIAMTQQATQHSGAVDKAKLKAGRKLIVRANRTDPEAVQPLLAYFRSFAEAGESPPSAAVAGLVKVMDSVPAAPKPRLLLGESLVRRGNADAARRVLRPIAMGPYESREQAEAAAILQRIGE